MQAPRQLLFGLRFDPLTMAEVVQRCRIALQTRRQLLIGVVNAAKAVNMRADATLRASLLKCDLLLADGQSIVWASKLLARPLPERVAGIDLFEQLLLLAERENHAVYLLGGREDVLKQLIARLAVRFPRLRIAGSRDGYFKDSESAEVAREIRGSGAEMLFLGMSSPKKEIFLGTYGSDLDVPILHGVGGSFDVLAGITKRAPLSWQRLGLEWAYRLLQEPRRMWRRYLYTNAGFVILTIREFFQPAPDWLAIANAAPATAERPLAKDTEENGRHIQR